MPGGKQEWLIAEIEGSWSERGATAETLTEMSTGLGLMVGEMLLDQGKLRGAAEWCEWAWKMQVSWQRS